MTRQQRRTSSRVLVSLLTLTATLGLPRLAQADTPPKGENWALIIGVNYERVSYEKVGLPEPSRSKVPELRNAVNDAKSLAGLLKEFYGFKADRVILLTEEQATKENILNTVQDFTRVSTEAKASSNQVSA